MPIPAGSSGCGSAISRRGRAATPVPIMPESPVALRFHAASGFDWLQRLAGWTGDLTGWRRHGLAFLLGVLAAAALPPVDLAPMLIVSFSGLIWLADGCRRSRDFFVLGWSFAFGFLLAGLYW